MAENMELNGMAAIELPTKYRDFKNLRVLRDSDDSFTMVPNWLMEWDEISMQEFAALAAILRKKDHFERDPFVNGRDKHARFDNGQHSKSSALRGLIDKGILTQTQYNIRGNWMWAYDLDVRASSFLYQGVGATETDDTDYEAVAKEEGVTVEQAFRLLNRGKEKEAAKHDKKVFKKKAESNDIQPHDLNDAAAPPILSPATEPMQPETVVSKPRLVEPVAPKLEKTPVLGVDVSRLVLGTVIRTMGKEKVKPATNGKPSWVDYEAPKQVNMQHVTWAQRLETDIITVFERSNMKGVGNVTAKIPSFLEENVDVVFDSYELFKRDFDMFSLKNAGSANAKASDGAGRHTPGANGNDKTKGTRFVNYEARYNAFAKALPTDESVQKTLSGIGINLTAQEWNIYINLYHARLSKDNCPQHDDLEAYRGHFCQWLPAGMAYRMKGEQINKAKNKQAAQQKAELRGGKGGRNPYFNRMRKKVMNPAPEKTFTEWQMWCVELLAMNNFAQMSEPDKVWFKQLETLSKMGKLKSVWDGVKAGNLLESIYKDLIDIT